MSWRRSLGQFSAAVVHLVARHSQFVPRWLQTREREVLKAVFGASLEIETIRVCEHIGGLLNVSNRAFVIERTMFLPSRYVPLREAVLVHEATHVWQFQHGGHAYIGDSLHAQLVGDGYDLQKGLEQGRRWAQLNCEQQATLVEWAYEQGCFQGRIRPTQLRATGDVGRMGL